MDKHQSKDETFLQRIADTPFTPIFIMGVQRSGTSILYKMLAETGYFNVTTAYHIISFDELLYNHHHQKENQVKRQISSELKQGGHQTRGIDELTVTPDFPEEYGFLLSRKTGVKLLQSKNKRFFIDLCKKVQYLSNNTHPILLKNPFDFSNFLYIKKQFPQATFVFIHRHPFHTLSSQLNAMSTLFQQKSTYMKLLSPWYEQAYSNPILRGYYKIACSPHNPLRIHHLIDTYEMQTNRFLQDLPQLQKQRDYICVRYEDLCDHPQETMKTILNHLDLRLPTNLDFTRFIKPRNPPIRKQIKKKQQMIVTHLKRYLQYHHYDY